MAYVLKDDNDMAWFNRVGDMNGNTTTNEVDFPTFVKPCVGKQIKYDFKGQRAILPNLITLAGVLDAILIEETDEMFDASNVVFDAVETFGLNHTSAKDATEWVFDRYINNTTGLAKMNPGLDVHSSHHFNPPLDQGIDFGLSDYIVKERLFTFFLNDGCIPFTSEHSLVRRLPITIHGVNLSRCTATTTPLPLQVTCLKQRRIVSKNTIGAKLQAMVVRTLRTTRRCRNTSILRCYRIHRCTTNRTTRPRLTSDSSSETDNVNFIKEVVRSGWTNESRNVRAECRVFR